MPSATILDGFAAGSDEAAAPCIRCKAHPAAHDLRSENVCTSCFVQYIQNKAIKRLELLQRETRALRSPRRLPARPQRYLLALSGGPSSACLLDVLYDNVLQQRAKGQRAKFELLVVHVVDDDVDVNAGPVVDSRETGQKAEESGIGETTTVRQFRKRFPEVEIRSVPLSDILQLDTIDWSTLPPTDIPGGPATSYAASPEPTLREQQPPGNNGDPQTQRRRLAHLFSQLPSATSRADVRRLLTRHLLITTAAVSSCDVLLLGYNTTSLAELTLSETAKGRGFALPWMVNDGVIPLPRSISDNINDRPQAEKGKNEADGTTEIPIYSLLRDIYRKELFVYLTSSSSTPSSSSSPPPLSSSTSQPPSTDYTATTEIQPQTPLSSLIPPHLLPPHLRDPSSSSSSSPPAPTAAVVSHRDLSIDDVMARYFADVEANYPSVVANVVRTTGKLAQILGGGGGVGAQKHDQHHHHHHHHVEEEEQQQQETGTAGGPLPAHPQQQRKPTGSIRCGICSLPLDEYGNERWRGELGELDAAAAATTSTVSSTADAPTKSATTATTATKTTGTAEVTSAAAEQQQQHRQRVRASGKLCYGCERSILG
ncbi:cytoplasmic tRNA 2-thiolation protein 2 [Microdochium nivale]|nr:cytoplasmic tRNA 2-thiolation protein 2 [Microdochium nivale]